MHERPVHRLCIAWNQSQVIAYGKPRTLNLHALKFETKLTAQSVDPKELSWNPLIACLSTKCLWKSLFCVISNLNDLPLKCKFTKEKIIKADDQFAQESVKLTYNVCWCMDPYTVCHELLNEIKKSLWSPTVAIDYLPILPPVGYDFLCDYFRS